MRDLPDPLDPYAQLSVRDRLELLAFEARLADAGIASSGRLGGAGGLPGRP
jgi:hypothetical protein